MVLNHTQVRILNALVAYEGDKITNEQLAARLLLPYKKLRGELYRIRRLAKKRSIKLLTQWWKQRLEWQQP
jgi:hypothetical protein